MLTGLAGMFLTLVKSLLLFVEVLSSIRELNVLLSECFLLSDESAERAFVLDELAACLVEGLLCRGELLLAFGESCAMCV